MLHPELPVAVARQRTEALLARFGLQDAADRRLRGFSTGMAQKVGLAQAFVVVRAMELWS